MNKSFVTVLALSVSAMLALTGCKWPCCCSCNDSCCKQQSTEPPHQDTGHVTLIQSRQEFDKLIFNSTKPIVVKFSATYCNTAKDELTPIFDCVAENLGATYTFVEVNISRVAKARIDFKITQFPTIIFIKNGKEVSPITRIVGTTNEATLRDTIKQVFEQ